MIKLIKNFFVFLVVILLVILCFYIFHKIKINSTLNVIRKNSYLIMGDSQMQRLSENNFSAKTFNFSSTAEPYYITYNKLKKILNSEHINLELILIGVSTHNFSPIYEKMFDFSSIEGLSFLNNHTYYLNLWDDFIPFSCFIKKDFYQGLIMGPLQNKIVKSSKSYPSKEVIKKSLKMHYFREETNSKINIQQKYLQKIVDLCMSNQIKLLFITMPVHEYYKANIPLEYKEELRHVLESFEIVNFNFMNLHTPDSLFSDGHHLNINGATHYSRLINDSINNKISK